ncbi:nuclear hormone receptor HR96-like isoform X1 [Centruroides sculpturatus]|uniref:nuclear hormone receptor HR96-like isoform X1 n=2 Tax=Centruroides sculpturatus TaxID=218467 RepID=UPI000C6D4AAB|nr:nuclear hormone receptor HR96-like isoform X1 [Centruroides sculpturatus]XP_023219760.1 nuclear hormone receptor HR96-like isoform X1 [Centruroides sculpturatus]
MKKMIDTDANNNSNLEKSEANKLCGVCGDKAFGYNFNAITCESCKAFFRRNALKTKEFKCPFDENCKVNIVTRRFCQKCRLKKCFDIGMKKEWILTDEEKKIKRAKIEENRQKRILNPDSKQLLDIELNSSNSCNLETSSLREVTKPQARVTGIQQPFIESSVDSDYLNNSENIINDIIEKSENNKQTDDDNSQSNNSDLSLENSICLSVKNMKGEEVPMMVTVLAMNTPNIRKSLNISQTTAVVQKTVQTESDTLNNYSSQNEFQSQIHAIDSLTTENKDEIVPKSVLQVAIETEFSKVPIREYNSSFKKLSETEHNKLDELIVANEILKMPLIFGVPDPSLLDVINMTDHAIRRLIKMSKKINGFKTLCQDDQIALLKGGCTELMILRSVMSYDPEKDCWHGPQGPKTMSIKVDILKEAKGNVYEEHKRFINSFDPVWRADENVMLILSAIALFTPERPNIVHKDVVKMEQGMYYYLLRRYLETVYSGCEARSIYLKLIKKIEELHILNEKHVRVFLDVNPKDVEPLLIEIFDLKH